MREGEREEQREGVDSSLLLSNQVAILLFCS